MYTMSYPYVSAGDALNLYFRSANMPAPNRMNWNDPETDQWLTAASAALTDKERAENFAKVQKKVHAAAVWIPIVHEPLFLISGPKLKPIKAHGNYGAGFYKGLGIELKG
jgi:peptide/nickel transport system substrate-binding protein